MRITRASRAARLFGAVVLLFGAAIAAKSSNSDASESLRYAKSATTTQIENAVEHQDAVTGEPNGLSMLLAALAVVCYQLYRKQRFLEQRPLSPTLSVELQ